MVTGHFRRAPCPVSLEGLMSTIVEFLLSVGVASLNFSPDLSKFIT